MSERVNWPDPRPDPDEEPVHGPEIEPDDDDDRPGFFERLHNAWEALWHSNE
jgi:hypothetical protein